MSTIVSTHKAKQLISTITPALLIGLVFFLSACGQALDEDDDRQQGATLRAQSMTTSDGPLPDPFDAPGSMTTSEARKAVPVLKTVKFKKVYLPTVESTLPKHPTHR